MIVDLSPNSRNKDENWSCQQQFQDCFFRGRLRAVGPYVQR